MCSGPTRGVALLIPLCRALLAGAAILALTTPTDIPARPEPAVAAPATSVVLAERAADLATSRASRTATRRTSAAVPRSLARGRAAAHFALKQRGKPYRRGGIGPRGYDCSGLTMAAWRRLGVRLPHSSRGQARWGRWVPRRDRQTGDLVLWSSGGRVYHVGVYYQRGLVVDAAKPGTRIKARRIWGRPTYRRLG
jgi:cell wall-associated NlpC family hydrolase